MSDIAKFRTMLAESGIETTLEEAEDLFKNAKKFIKVARKMTLKEIWGILDVEDLGEEEKKDMVRLYQQAKEI